MQKIKFGENRPVFIFIDEFDAFYHNSLSESIVKQLLKNDIQILMTTHNSSLLSNDILRPDCYFLMYKDHVKSVAMSTDKDLRKGHNIEKMYRAGAFDE
jgi:AAA15 family ATPase/GTPase